MTGSVQYNATLASTGAIYRFSRENYMLIVTFNFGNIYKLRKKMFKGCGQGKLHWMLELNFFLTYLFLVLAYIKILFSLC